MERSKTAQTVYSDEVTDGVLAYTLALTGGDAASGVEISDVSCYQSGSGKTKALGSAESGQIELLVNADGSEGEKYLHRNGQIRSRRTVHLQNQCSLQAARRREGYHRDESDRRAEGDERTEIMLTVSAWSEKRRTARASRR